MLDRTHVDYTDMVWWWNGRFLGLLHWLKCQNGHENAWTKTCMVQGSAVWCCRADRHRPGSTTAVKRYCQHCRGNGEKEEPLYIYIYIYINTTKGPGHIWKPPSPMERRPPPGDLGPKYIFSVLCFLIFYICVDCGSMGIYSDLFLWFVYPMFEHVFWSLFYWEVFWIWWAPILEIISFIKVEHTTL